MSDKTFPDNRSGAFVRRCHWCPSIGTTDGTEGKHFHCGCSKKGKPAPEHPEGGFIRDDHMMMKVMMGRYGHFNGFGVRGNSIHPKRKSKAFAR